MIKRKGICIYCITEIETFYTEETDKQEFKDSLCKKCPKCGWLVEMVKI